MFVHYSTADFSLCREKASALNFSSTFHVFNFSTSRYDVSMIKEEERRRLTFSTKTLTQEGIMQHDLTKHRVMSLHVILELADCCKNICSKS